MKSSVSRYVTAGNNVDSSKERFLSAVLGVYTKAKQRVSQSIKFSEICKRHCISSVVL